MAPPGAHSVNGEHISGRRMRRCALRELAVLTERHVTEQLERLLGGYRPALEGLRADVLDAIAAAMVQDSRMRDLLADWPTVAARGSWCTHWRVRRRIASTLRQLQFAIRRYDHGSARLVRMAAAIAHAADALIANERSYVAAYDSAYSLTIAESDGLREVRRWAGGALPPELRLFAFRPAAPVASFRRVS
jgi:hypothetical protein